MIQDSGEKDSLPFTDSLIQSNHLISLNLTSERWKYVLSSLFEGYFCVAFQWRGLIQWMSFLSPSKCCRISPCIIHSKWDSLPFSAWSLRTNLAWGKLQGRHSEEGTKWLSSVTSIRVPSPRAGILVSPFAPTKGLCGKKSHREGCLMLYLHFLPHCGQQLGKSARAQQIIPGSLVRGIKKQGGEWCLLPRSWRVWSTPNWGEDFF